MIPGPKRLGFTSQAPQGGGQERFIRCGRRTVPWCAVRPPTPFKTTTGATRPGIDDSCALRFGIEVRKRGRDRAVCPSDGTAGLKRTLTIRKAVRRRRAGEVPLAPLPGPSSWGGPRRAPSSPLNKKRGLTRRTVPDLRGRRNATCGADHPNFTTGVRNGQAIFRKKVE